MKKTLKNYIGQNFDLVALTLLSKEGRLAASGILEIVKKEFEVSPLSHLVQNHLGRLTNQGYIELKGNYSRQITEEGKDYLKIVYQVKEDEFYFTTSTYEIKKVHDEIVKRNLDEILLDMFSQKADYSGTITDKIKSRTRVLFSDTIIWNKKIKMEKEGMITSKMEKKGKTRRKYNITPKGEKHLELLNLTRTKVDEHLKSIYNSKPQPYQF